MGQGELRIDGDRLAVAFDRLERLPLGRQRSSQADVGVGVLRIESDRLMAAGDGFVGLPLGLQRCA